MRFWPIWILGASRGVSVPFLAFALAAKGEWKGFTRRVSVNWELFMASRAKLPTTPVRSFVMSAF